MSLAADIDQSVVISAIRQCPLFSSCTQQTIQLLLKKGIIERHAIGAKIFATGDPSGWFYVLISGHISVTHHGQPLSSNTTPGYVGGLTSAVHIAELGPNATEANKEGPMARRSFSNRAVTDTTILRINVDLFHTLASSDTDFLTGIMRFFSQRLRNKNSRLASMMLEQKSGGSKADDVVIISVYDAKKYDRENLTESFKDAVFDSKKVKLHFIDAKLDMGTVPLAAGSDAICIFVNDTANGKVLRALKVIGIELILLRCAGFNGVDLNAAHALKISVARVPAYSPYAVAEHALALLMTVTRRTHRAFARVRDGNFKLDGLQGRDLHGLTVGVIGTGKIGRCFALIAKGLGMKLLLYDMFPNETFAKEVGGTYESDFKKIVSQADVISFHLPLTKHTTHIYDQDIVENYAKNEQVVINVSRGPIIDTEAILQGVLSGKLGGAGLDVLEKEKEYFFEDKSERAIADQTMARLVNLPNVVVTSHQAFLTKDALNAIANTTKFNASEYFHERKRGVELSNAVVPARVTGLPKTRVDKKTHLLIPNSKL